MPGIFISYRRRGESAGYAGRLAAELRREFGDAQLFRDIDDIEPGVDFVDVITRAVGSCDVLIAVIGPDWLDPGGTTGRRRLDDPHDFVHLEVATALERNVRVIPVLVGGATMPAADELPDRLKPLARRQAHELSDRRWDFDFARLVASLKGFRPPGTPREPAPGGLLTKRRVVVATLLAIACGTGVALVWWFFVVPPRIDTFAAVPDSIEAGQPATLSWRTRNATEVALDAQAVAFSGSARVKPSATTSHRLSASNRSRSTERAITVVVQALALRILSFDAMPRSIKRGQQAVVHWATSGATTVTLDRRPVRSSDSMPVTPQVTTTYELVAADGGGGTVRRAVKLQVSDTVRMIRYFGPQRASIVRGEQTQLCYGVLGANSAHIEPVVGAVQPIEKECVSIAPTQTTTYTLVAAGAEPARPSETATTTVQVLAAPPVIRDFVALPARVVPGQATKLCYTTANATSARVDPGVAPLAGPLEKNCIVVTPKQTTQYTLTVSASDGQQAQHSLTVVVALFGSPAKRPAPIPR